MIPVKGTMAVAHGIGRLLVNATQLARENLQWRDALIIAIGTYTVYPTLSRMAKQKALLVIRLLIDRARSFMGRAWLGVCAKVLTVITASRVTAHLQLVDVVARVAGASANGGALMAGNVAAPVMPMLMPDGRSWTDDGRRQVLRARVREVERLVAMTRPSGDRVGVQQDPSRRFKCQNVYELTCPLFDASLTMCRPKQRKAPWMLTTSSWMPVLWSCSRKTISIE